MTPYMKFIFNYGVIIFLLISLYKTTEILYLNRVIELDNYSFLIAIISLLLGIYISIKIPINNRPPLKLSPLPLINNSDLSNRELEVLILLSKGHINKEISDLLFVSLNTTKTHLSNIYSKLGASNRVQAIKVARECGIIEY